MKLVDTHAHLYWDSFKEDFDEVIQRALDAGISAIINVGVDVEKSRLAAQLESRKVKFYSTIGIHPHEAANFSPDQIETLEKIYRSDPQKVVAVGECGLDYKEIDDTTVKNLQKQLFQAQIDLAKKLNLPLIVHCREAWDEVLEITKEHFGIYHCYSGLPQTTSYILQNTKFLISFAATITYPKNDYLREAAKLIPLDRIVLETDCPFLPPQTKRGQRNEPANILETAQILADVKGISLAKVANQTSNNAREILRLRSG